MKRKELKQELTAILNRLYAAESELQRLGLPIEALRFVNIAEASLNGAINNLNDRRN